MPRAIEIREQVARIRAPWRSASLALGIARRLPTRGRNQSARRGPGSAAAGRDVGDQARGPGHAAVRAAAGRAPDGMVWIPGGTFWMGADDATMPDAGPVHEVTRRRLLDGPDRGHQPPVRARSSRRPATSRWPSARPTRRISRRAAGEARPGLAGLHAAGRRGLAGQPAGRGGATSRARTGGIPKGRETSIEGKDDYPVVQVCWDDAVGLRHDGPASGCRPRPSGNTPPAAARSGPGSSGATSCRPGGKWQANIWQGQFPDAEHAGGRLHPDRPGRRRSRPTPSGCMTWPATSGNGAPTGIGRATTSASPATRRARRRATTPTSPASPSASSAGARSSAPTSTARRYLPAPGARGPSTPGRRTSASVASSPRGPAADAAVASLSAG